jgi:hypothetical protein
MRHKNIWRLLILLSCLLVLSLSAGLAQPARAKDVPSTTLKTLSSSNINLSKCLGYEAAHAANAWMLNDEVCVVLLRPPEADYAELALVHVEDVQVLSRTSVAGISYLRECRWDDDVLYLVFAPPYSEDTGVIPEYIKASIAQDETVSLDTVPSDGIIMPDGDTFIHEAGGSLYAIDLLTGGNTLLLQGVPDPYSDSFQGDTYEIFQQYEAGPDEMWYDGTNEDGYPLSLAIDEETFYDNEIQFWRNYHVVKALDDSRFIYAVYGWEWGAGFGIYDLKTHTNYRITGRGYFYDTVGNTLYGSYLTADSETYQSTPLPLALQEQFEKVNAQVDEVTDYSVAPNGRLVAFMSDLPDESDYKLLSVMDAQSGNTLWVWALEFDESPDVFRIHFYNNTQLMIYIKSEYEPAQLFFVDFVM